MRLGYAIVFVSDMPRSVAFYRDVLELPLRFESPEWTEFATDGATLALHAAPTSASAPAAPASTTAGRCQPGLTVPDLDGFHRRMIEHHVPCIRPPTDEFGVRLAQYSDPDGLTLSLSEARRPG
ncbi:MAG: VOC family protein [Betaproteobacteria bacterium]